MYKIDLDRMWAYDEPYELLGNRHVEMSERQILDTYFGQWSKEMDRAGMIVMVTPENCIVDWIVVNWAYEVKAESNKQ